MTPLGSEDLGSWVYLQVAPPHSGWAGVWSLDKAVPTAACRGPHPEPQPCPGWKVDHERALPEASSPCSGPLVSCSLCLPWSLSWRLEPLHFWEHGLVTVPADLSKTLSPGLPATQGPGRLTFLSSHSAQNRGRLADKRTVALPPARVLKKELTPSFSASDGDSDGSGPACGQRPGLKQEDDTHVRIMKRR